MKIICDTCGAKYSIADEKVRGKVFKIRCKKCSEIIVVRGTTEPEEATCPLGVRAFDRYMVDYEEAIAIMQSMDCGATFAELSLSWPQTPEAGEPQWRIKTTLGGEIVIGANCGRAEGVTAGCSTAN